jgi:hypothetical protein
MTIHRRQLALGSALVVGSRFARADDGADDVIARVARARAPIRTLKGPFQQKRTIGLLATDVRSRGTLVLVRPDHLRWELAPPDEVTFWVGPDGFGYKSAHGQGRLPASSARIGGALEDLRTMLGGDLSKLRERWELRVVQHDANGAEVEATPRAGVVARLQRLRLSLAADLARPVRALLVEGPRDRTLIEFGALVVNEPVDESTMRPPP